MDDRTITLENPHVVIVGFSGRDEAAVRLHVAELAAEGVPAPESVPAFWEVPSYLLTQDASIAVASEATSGEAEPVLVGADGEVFLTVGSDHTDRELERVSYEKAKLACPKVIARACRPAPDDWDALMLRSRSERDGAWRTYQEAALAHLRPIAWFLERLGDGSVMFCGTVPTIGGLETRATSFEAELDGMRCCYEIR